MKNSTLLCIALTILGASWLLLAGSSRYAKRDAEKLRVADFFVTVLDEDGAPLAGYLARIDGKLVGRTNKMGMVSKTALGIGNVPTIVMSLQSTRNKYEKKREILLTLPAQRDLKVRAAYSIAVALCLDFVTCEEDSFSIYAGKKAPQLVARGKSARVIKTPDHYEFVLASAGDGSHFTGAVIRELRQKLSSRKITGITVPVEVKIAQVMHGKSERMIRITGKRKDSGSVDHDFAFLIPSADSAASLAATIYSYLLDTRPGRHLPKGRRQLTMSFKEAVGDTYEIYAGGIKGEIVNAGSWNISVPSSGRFFLTIYNKGKVIKRKFFDAKDAQHLDFDK